MKQLDLPDGIRSTVYTVIVGALTSDPKLSATIAAGGWRTYLEDDDDEPAGEDDLPSLECLPFGVGAAPASLVTQDSDFGIAINVATDGSDVRDLLNLWELVEGALFKGDGTATIHKKLGDALRTLGRGQVANVALTAPGITPAESGLNRQKLVAAGSILVKLKVPK